MGLSDLLVVLDDDTKAAGAYALWLATTSGAGLTAASPVIRPDLPPYASAEIPSEILARAQEEAENAARAALSRFSDTAKEGGITVHQRLFGTLAGEVAREITNIARFYDLTIVDQGDPERPHSLEIIESVLFGSGRPILAVPYFFKPSPRLRTALVAWDNSSPAARALGNALPLLALANEVQIVTVAEVPDETVSRAHQELVRHLARHGIDATPRTLISVGDVANTLLSHIADTGADLLVMGGYGHSRVREMVLGGATRDILRAMTAPVLMSH
jgi:nucleotide-binding universal stress UspA family protein